MFRPKSLLAFALVVGTLLLAGTAFAQGNDRIIIGAGAEITTLDPRLATDVPSFERIAVILEPLVVFGYDLGLQPRLATEWEFAEDGSSLTFKLREGVTFHDGKPFTSADVKYTFEWVLDPEHGAQNRPLYEDIVSIDTPDDHTVVMNLGALNSFLLNNIARMPIVPEGAGEEFGNAPIGTGPYRFVELVRDDRLVVSAYADYWGGAPNVETLVFRPIPEDATRLLAFEAGEIDMMQAQPVPTELPRIEADDRFVVQRAPGTGYTYVGMNTKSGPLADVRVRQAISYLIPREAVVARILNGIGQPGISMLSPEMSWFNPDVERYAYDPEKAAALLAEAGIGQGASLRLHTNENAVRMQLAEILGFELGQLGVNLDITIEEFGAFLERVQTTDDFDLFILGWSGQLDPDRAMIRQFTTTGSANYTFYSNERVDELLSRGRLVDPTSQESIDIYQEAQAIVLDEAPYAFAYYTEEIAFSHPWIGGWNVHPYGAATYQNAHLLTKNR
ncbi:MAG: ABC transporter substrate-binding protein [Propioniciclava sp.]|nr:ABC transporter substrate-binding protein [Propioniciclava sp.]